MLKCNTFINIIHCVFHAHLNFLFIHILYSTENNLLMTFTSMYSNLATNMISIYFLLEDKIFKKSPLTKRPTFKVFVLDPASSCL